MSNFFKRNLKGDPVVWMIWFMLVFMSIVEMFSASSYLISINGSISSPIIKHITFLGLGFVAILLTQLVSMKYLRLLGYLGLLFSIVLLIYTLFKGVTQAGAARFLPIGGVQFQPSELARLSLILVAADLIDRFQNKEIEHRYFWVFALAAYIIIGLIVTENLSTAVLLAGVMTMMLFVGTVSFKKIIVFITIPTICIVAILSIAMSIPEEKFIDHGDQNKMEKVFYSVFKRAYTWVPRLEHFVDGGKESEEHNKYTLDGQFQFAHAQVAIARGGVLPHFPGSSVQRNYLPEAFSDFIFAIIVEELGLLGGIMVILLYLFLLYRAGRVAKSSTNVFSAVLVIGVTLIIVAQAFVHIGVCVGIVPLTGQPLPMISKGGTSILVNSVYFGIIIAVTRSIYNEDGTSKLKDSEEEAAVVVESEYVEEPSHSTVELIEDEVIADDDYFVDDVTVDSEEELSVDEAEEPVGSEEVEETEQPVDDVWEVVADDAAPKSGADDTKIVIETINND